MLLEPCRIADIRLTCFDSAVYEPAEVRRGLVCVARGAGAECVDRTRSRWLTPYAPTQHCCARYAGLVARQPAGADAAA